MCHQSSKNSLLRLMTGIHTYETVRIMRTIGLLKKINNQKTHRGPRKLLQNWEDWYATWSYDPETDTRKIRDVCVSDPDFLITNCRKIWAEHWRDVYYTAKTRVNKKWIKKEEEALYKHLKLDIKIPGASSNYKKPEKGIDPLICHLNSIELSQFLNLMNGGHPIYWKKRECPWCGCTSDGRHILEQCVYNNCDEWMSIAMNTENDIDIRVNAAKEVILFGGMMENALGTGLQLTGRNIFPINYKGGIGLDEPPTFPPSVPGNRGLKKNVLHSPQPVASSTVPVPLGDESRCPSGYGGQ